MRNVRSLALSREVLRAAPILAVTASLILCDPDPACADEDACALHEWLVWLYDAGEELANTPPGAAAEEKAIRLAQSVTSANSERVGHLMTAVGLGNDMPTVAAYLILLKARLINYAESGAAEFAASPGQRDTHPAAKGMAALVDTLECDADPDWKPAGRDKRHERPPAHPKISRRDLRSGAIAAGALLGAIFAAAAAVFLGGKIFAFLERRRNTRHPCRMLCTLKTPENHQSAVAVDISRTGAKLKVPKRMVPQSRCSFEAGALRAQARVLWSNTHFTGIAFTAPIDPSELETLLRQHQWNAPASGPLPDLDLANFGTWRPL